MEEDASAWRRHAAVQGIVARRLYKFAGRVIAYGLRGRLDAARLAQIRAEAVRDMKNVDASGFPIDEEAEILRQAIETFEQLIDAAIVEGRDAKET